MLAGRLTVTATSSANPQTVYDPAAEGSGFSVLRLKNSGTSQLYVNEPNLHRDQWAPLGPGEAIELAVIPRQLGRVRTYGDSAGELTVIMSGI